MHCIPLLDYHYLCFLYQMSHRYSTRCYTDLMMTCCMKPFDHLMTLHVFPTTIWCVFQFDRPSFCWCWYNTALFMWFNRASQLDFLEETCKMLVTKEPHMNLERNKFLFLFVFYALLSLISLAEGEWYYFIYTTFFYDVAILYVFLC